MKSIVVTNKGKRKINQDIVLIESINDNTFLYLIADGMGGYDAGAEAAKIVSDSISTFLRHSNSYNENDVQKAINKANLSIRQYSEDNNLKLGATVGGVILKGYSALFFWVGDVKIFHFTNNKLIWESQPHTLINQIIDNGSIKDMSRLEKYKHVVTHSIQGDIEHSQMSVHSIDNLSSNDLLLVCSDGVHDIFEGIALQQILNSSNSVDEAIERIEKRLKIDAKDNYSFILNKIN